MGYHSVDKDVIVDLIKNGITYDQCRRQYPKVNVRSLKRWFWEITHDDKYLGDLRIKTGKCVKTQPLDDRVQVYLDEINSIYACVAAMRSKAIELNLQGQSTLFKKYNALMAEAKAYGLEDFYKLLGGVNL